jgi:hypothetical protein
MTRLELEALAVMLQELSALADVNQVKGGTATTRLPRPPDTPPTALPMRPSGSRPNHVTGRTSTSEDPGSEEHGEGGWGGLSEFSGRANAAVAYAVANADRKSSK